MNLEPIFKKTIKALSDNSSVILTGAAVAGTVTTAIFSAKGAFEHGTDEAIHGTPESPKERFKQHYKHYIPAAVSGTTTIACIVGIHSINTRRQAALISAYSIVDKAFIDYREKVVETIGANQETKVRDEVAKESMEAKPVGATEVLITGSGDQLCFDTMTGRYFKSDIETIRKAQNDVNAEALNNMYCSQNEFYSKIGLGHSTIGDEMGWTSDRLMDISFSTHLSEDGRPCLCLNYIPSPVRNYWKV